MKKIFTSIVMLLMAISSFADSDCYMYIPKTTVKAGEATELSLCLYNKEIAAAYQVDIEVPEGFSFVQQTGVNEDDEEYTYYCTRQSRVLKSFSIGENLKSSQVLSNNAFSTTGKLIKNNDGALFTFQIKIAKGTAEGNIVLTKTEATINNTGVNCDNVISVTTSDGGETYVIGASDTATGINDINNNSLKSEYYSVDGQSQKNLQKGLNIVKTADGVKKVMVK